MIMFVMKGSKHISLTQAVDSLTTGGIIAYPTESCFGLGCDPSNAAAIKRILSIKSRSERKGLIVIAASIEQAQEYIDLDASPLKSDIVASWPGANTWLLPAKKHVEPLLRGQFPLLAVRVTNHPIANAICQQFGGAIVSTSANVAGEEAIKTHQQVRLAFLGQVDVIVEGLVGGDEKPSTIRDGLTGEILRQ